MTRGSVAVLGVLLLGLFAAAGCGYALAGRGSALPAYIETIGVPLFENDTAFFEVEQRLTDRVRSELIGRGRYRVVPEGEGVDGLLNGEIRSISIRPTSFDARQQATRYVFTLTARIEFRDLRADAIIWDTPALVFREEYEAVFGDDALDPNVFFSQDSNAVDRIAEDFARTVVSAILEAF